MKKLLHLEIEDSCENCPYCRYNPHYSMSHDSGYDCENDNALRGRIANDWELSSKIKTLKIPEWCPLPECSLYDSTLGAT